MRFLCNASFTIFGNIRLFTSHGLRSEIPPGYHCVSEKRDFFRVLYIEVVDVKSQETYFAFRSCSHDVSCVQAVQLDVLSLFHAFLQASEFLFLSKQNKSWYQNDVEIIDDSKMIIKNYFSIISNSFKCHFDVIVTWFCLGLDLYAIIPPSPPLLIYIQIL